MDKAKFKVLVIDDEASMRDSCRMILEKEGFDTDTAENGIIGLEKIEANRPDFVIIDLKMPRMSGQEVLEKVREIDRDIIPIVITGYATVESAVEAMKKGAYDFLPKPFSPEELRIIMRRGLERKKLIRETKRLRKEKKLMEENFVTMVSHQLRSPLVAIVQYFEIILAGMVGDVEDKQREMILKAKERSEGLLNLINDWLSIARMNGGQIVENQKPTSLKEILSKIVDFLQPVAKEKNVSLKLEAASGDDVILGDSESLEQLFVNLIANAIEYNKPEGSVSVSLDDLEDSIQVDIEDTGVGIAPEHIPLIFDQFYQIDRSKRKGDKGSGLGLAIAKKIAEAHRGSIQVSSELGKGSIFTVTFPKTEKKN
ncbi:MAG: hybrid sensor histidine kinase/response regulator [Candidatus Aminicenantes bacterium]|jgi:signal transduction histidine kinase